jgi:hypothetical protein
VTSYQQARALQELLEQVAERIKDDPMGRSYMTPDEDAYVLALGGESAKAMREFMKAVGKYLVETKNGRHVKETATEEVQRAFDEWLSKQEISSVS